MLRRPSALFNRHTGRLYSTKMALLKIINDMFEVVDLGRTTSITFDTKDYSILLSRRKSSFRVTGPALSLVRSYLTDQTSFVNVGSAPSLIIFYNTDVLQGSVLGPLLFSLFNMPLGKVVSAFGVKFHQYTDDTQIYLDVEKENSLQTLYSKYL